MINRCLLDTNIVLDEIQERQRLSSIKEQIFQNFDEFFISVKTFSTIFYILRKYDFKKDAIYNSLKKYKLLSITEEICDQGFKWAKNSQDVEDCMELAVAFYNDCVFITADQHLEQAYSDLVDIQVVN